MNIHGPNSVSLSNAFPDRFDLASSFRLISWFLAVVLLIAGAITAPGANAAGGAVTFSPSSASFGTVDVGHTGGIALKISNTGTASLTIAGYTLTGSEFSVSGLSTPVSLGPQASVTVTLKFNPTVGGVSTGQLTLSSGGANSGVSYSMAGTGAGVQVTATPSSAPFGNVPLGTTNTQAIMVRNLGAKDITISKVTISGSGFAFTNLPTPKVVFAGTEHTLYVEFSPATTGARTGTISIQSSATNPQLTI